MMGWYGDGTGALGWLGMGVFWLILLGLIVWLVMRLLPGSGRGTTRPTGESAAETLDRPLPRGEIDDQVVEAQRVTTVQDARPGARRDRG